MRRSRIRNRNLQQWKVKFILATNILLACLICPSNAKYTPNTYLEAEGDENPLTRKEYDECVGNLYTATSVHNDMFEVEAYLQFIDLESKGSIRKTKFDFEILGLVHIYWFVVCSVNEENCAEDQGVTVHEIMEYEARSGVFLIYQLCKRVDLYLGRITTTSG